MRRIRDQGIKRTQGPDDQRTRGPGHQRIRRTLNYFSSKFIFPVKFAFCSRVLDLFPGNLDIFPASSRENPERILQEFQVPLGCEIVSLKKKTGFVDEIRSTVAEMAEIPRVPLQADLVQ
jgi:hypothetical protein